MHIVAKILSILIIKKSDLVKSYLSHLFGTSKRDPGCSTEKNRRDNFMIRLFNDPEAKPLSEARAQFW